MRGRVRSAWQAARGPPEHIGVLQCSFDGVCITSSNLMLSPAPRGLTVAVGKTDKLRERQHMQSRYIAWR